MKLFKVTYRVSGEAIAYVYASGVREIRFQAEAPTQNVVYTIQNIKQVEEVEDGEAV